MPRRAGTTSRRFSADEVARQGGGAATATGRPPERTAPAQMGTRYAFTGAITSDPYRGTAYRAALELWGDTHGGLLGWLALHDGTMLRLVGQSANGNVTMVIVMGAGLPMFTSGTTARGGIMQGSIAGPFAGDYGAWTAIKQP